ncbi:MAG: DUF1799 domain-containing protein [Acidobacteriales bacterium]|nr:DUF1799 domain-containing protein [Terriglobales bacterium]
MTCPDRRPDLCPENLDIWEVWSLASGQWRTTGFGLLSMDWPAVAECAAWIGVDVRIPRVLEGLRRLERAVLDHQARDTKKD